VTATPEQMKALDVLDALDREVRALHAIDAAVVGLTHPNDEVADASYEGIRVLLTKHIDELRRIAGEVREISGLPVDPAAQLG
jgi:hypothetical protein